MGQRAFLAILFWFAVQAVTVIRRTPPTATTLSDMVGCLVSWILLVIVAASLFPAVQ
jgi:hypothetical protein